MGQNNLELVVLDVETSGMRPEDGHCVIELGAQRLRGTEILASFDYLIKPSRPLDPESQAVHGITEAELLEKGREPAEVFAEFREFSKDAVLVGHNVGFDLAFINAEYRRLGQEALTNEILDTIALARRYLILPSYSLKNVAAYLKVPQPSAHRALADVQTTTEVLLKLIERAKQR
ncbi:MAG: 3'-5' exonuclease [Candidatus Nomurabacteria bacterium]|nr:MAG: 3'-5' exonuclease [Candidatus Nomurabacteria bacterium]